MKDSKKFNIDTILFKIENNRFQEGNSLFSINAFVSIILNVLHYIIIFSSILVITFLILNETSFSIPVISFVLPLFYVIILFLWVWFITRLEDNRKLNQNEINFLFEDFQNNDELLKQINHLYKTQGFILEKQRDEFLKYKN